jgi:hypothetical protein
MHGIALDQDVKTWFDLPGQKTPKTTISRQAIAKALKLQWCISTLLTE